MSSVAATTLARPHAGALAGAPRTVADAMITDVKISGPTATVRELRALFADEHVHTAVIVADGVLLAVVDRTDLEGRRDDDTVAHLGNPRSRVVAPDADLAQAWQLLLASERRRLAVVGDGRFRGLLCLKRTRAGFCSDRDVDARRIRRSASPGGPAARRPG